MYNLASGGESSPLYGFSTNPAHSDRISVVRGTETDIKAAGRTINTVQVDALVHSRGRLAESCLLKSNRSPRSLGMLAGKSSWGIPCWIYQPQSVPVECRMVLRLCLLISPASSGVSDAEDGALCRCNRRVCLTADPMHFFHSFKASASAGTTTNAIVDHIGPDDEEPCDIVVQRETLVHLPPSPTNSPPPRRGSYGSRADSLKRTAMT